jgi:hypothetical protein
MPRKPALLLHVSDVKCITISDDPLEGAILRFGMHDDPNDLELHLPALCVARLQALLLEADAEQARLKAPQ